MGGSMVALWLQVCCTMVALWLQYGCNMVALWLQYGYHIVALWLHYGCIMTATLYDYYDYTVPGVVFVHILVDDSTVLILPS
jgi:hypothetical protein